MARSATRRRKISKVSNLQQRSAGISDDVTKDVEHKLNPAPPFDSLYVDRKNYQALVGFDVGTSKVEVSYAVVAKGDSDPLAIYPQPIPLQGGDTCMPALIGIKPLDETGTRAELVFGRDVEYALRTGEIQPDNVWSNLKQGEYLMNTKDTIFKDKREGLIKTQQAHKSVLAAASQFEEIVVRFPRGTKKIYHQDSKAGSNSLKMDNIEDVFVLWLSWVYDYAKHALTRVSSLPLEEVDRLFESEQVRIGVAVPDILPASCVTKYYDLVVRSGFDRRVQMLSEARCAAVKVLRDMLKSGAGSSLRDLVVKDIDVCDIGHGTTDISTIRAADEGSSLRFKFVTDPTGNASGGKVIEDHLINGIGVLFRTSLKKAAPTLPNGKLIPPNTYLEGFRFGVSQAKRHFGIESVDEGEVTVIYQAPHPFKPLTSATGVKLYHRGITMPTHVMKECYDVFLRPIIRTTKAANGRPGLLQKHYNIVEHHGEFTPNRHIFLVGGAATPDYVQAEIKQALKSIPSVARVPVSYLARNGQAFVADGGVIMLNDGELSKRRFHSESLGCIVYPDEPETCVEQAVWFFKIPMNTRPIFEDEYTYSIRLTDRSNPNDPTFKYPVDFEWRFARTSDEELGRMERPLIANRKIHTDQGIKYGMSKELCDFIGWSVDSDGDWELMFKFKLRVALEGQIVECTIMIPKGGKFGEEGIKQETKSFKQLMTANLSHLVEEGDWVVSCDQDVDDA